MIMGMFALENFSLMLSCSDVMIITSSSLLSSTILPTFEFLDCRKLELTNYLEAPLQLHINHDVTSQTDKKMNYQIGKVILMFFICCMSGSCLLIDWTSVTYSPYYYVCVSVFSLCSPPTAYPRPTHLSLTWPCPVHSALTCPPYLTFLCGPVRAATPRWPHTLRLT